MKKIGFIITIWLSVFTLQAQCNVNTSICSGSNAGPFNFVYPGNPVSTCLDFYGPSVGYIILNISGSGNLNMLINGNSNSGFIDVAVFNIPQGVAPCTAIQSNSNQILCNYASSSVGCAQFGGQFSCSANIGTVQVQAGQQLMIVAENWSGSSNSFTLQMSNAPGSATAGLPDATITPVSDICISGNPIQLSAVSMGGTWSGTGVSATGLFNPATAGIGSHTISYAIGVSPCNSSDQTVINVVDDPVISLTSNSPICTGQTLIFTNDLIPGATYTWTGPNYFSSSAQSVEIPNVTQAASGTYTLQVNNGGCISMATTVVDISPAVTILIDSVSPVCLKDSVVGLSVIVTSSAVNNSYTGAWSGNGVMDSYTTVFDPAVAGVGTHKVYYTVEGFCGNRDSIEIVVKPHPKFEFSSPLTVDCSPLQTDALVSSDLMLNSLLIDFGNGDIRDSVGNHHVVYDSAGCYTIKIHGNSLGCESDTIFPAFFCVEPNPVSIPSVVNNTATEYDPEFIFMNNSERAIKSLWLFGDGTTSEEVEPKHTYTIMQPSEYLVNLIVESDFGCKDTAHIYVRVIEDIVFFVPNTFTPDGDEYNNVFKPVMTAGFRKDSYTLLVFNRWGETVFESHDPDYGWDGTFQGALCKDDTYTWMITFKSIETSETFRHTGFITLIK